MTYYNHIAVTILALASSVNGSGLRGGSERDLVVGQESIPVTGDSFSEFLGLTSAEGDRNLYIGDNAAVYDLGDIYVDDSIVGAVRQGTVRSWTIPDSIDGWAPCWETLSIRKTECHLDQTTAQGYDCYHIVNPMSDRFLFASENGFRVDANSTHPSLNNIEETLMTWYFKFWPGCAGSAYANGENCYEPFHEATGRTLFAAGGNWHNNFGVGNLQFQFESLHSLWKIRPRQQSRGNLRITNYLSGRELYMSDTYSYRLGDTHQTTNLGVGAVDFNLGGFHTDHDQECWRRLELQQEGAVMCNDRFNNRYPCYRIVNPCTGRRLMIWRDIYTHQWDNQLQATVNRNRQDEDKWLIIRVGNDQIPSRTNYDCDAKQNCYAIIYQTTYRARLYAQAGKNYEAGAGVAPDEHGLVADQIWILNDFDSGDPYVL